MRVLIGSRERLYKNSFEDCDSKSTQSRERLPSLLTGRSKRNIPLPIFKNEPMGRNNEYTSTLQSRYTLGIEDFR